MKRANLYRRWTDARLARELVKAARRGAALAEELNRRARTSERAEEEHNRETWPKVFCETCKAGGACALHSGGEVANG